MKGIIKIVKSLKESEENEAKEQKGGLLNILLGTLGVVLLGNLIAAKCTITAGERTIRARQDF